MFLDDLTAPLEAVLFAGGDPLSEEQLMDALQVDREVLTELLDALARTLDGRKSGIMLREVAGGWQLATRPEHYQYVEKMARAVDRKLSPAALETLAIIAFRQPVTKQEIEDIRGVHVERMLSQLIARELIAEVGRKEVVGRPILYGTTDVFLRCIGLKALGELPDLPEIDPKERVEQMTLLDAGQDDAGEG